MASKAKATEGKSNGSDDKQKRSTKADASMHAALLRSETISELSPDDTVLREFISDFAAASALMRKLRTSLAAKLGLSAAGYSVLLGVWSCERKGKTSVRDLADHLHIAAAHVTAEIGDLMDLCLVTKVPSETDKRAVSIRLSKSGRELFNTLSPVLRSVNVPLFAGVQYSDMVVVHRFLKRIVEQAPDAIRVAEKIAPPK
jgi:DNA-binding MarR family transcriptional regulator